MIYNILSGKPGQKFKHTVGGSISSITVSCFDPNKLSVAITATQQVISSTVVVDATAGDESFKVDSLTGLRLNEVYVLKNGTFYEQQFGISSMDTVTKIIIPFRPLQQNFPAGSTIDSTAITFTFPDALNFNLGYRIELSYLDFYGEEKFETISFNAVPYSLKSDVTIETLASLDGLINDKIPSGTNFNSLKEACWEMLIARVHANKNLGTLVGTINLTNPHSFLILAQLAQSAGPEYLEYRNSLLKRFDEELHSVLSSVQTFGNQQGFTKQHDWFKFIDIARG
jgi:hypothetical protein